MQKYKLCICWVQDFFICQIIVILSPLVYLQSQSQKSWITPVPAQHFQDKLESINIQLCQCYVGSIFENKILKFRVPGLGFPGNCCSRKKFPGKQNTGIYKTWLQHLNTVQNKLCILYMNIDLVIILTVDHPFYCILCIFYSFNLFLA